MYSVPGNFMRPSAAHIWSVCNGHVLMRQKYPEAPDEADSEVTEDGTACHWLASETWEGRVLQEGQLAPNGRVLTDEMFDGVDTYHGVLRSWPGVHAECEKFIPIPRIVQGMCGTPDAFAYNPETKTLYVADLKFGFRFVEVWYNLQLICYACGLIDLLGLSWADTKIVFTVVQPRSFHRDGPVRTWNTTANDILPYVTMLAAAAQRSAVVYMPNPGCYDCPGRHECTAYQNAALAACEVAYGGGSTHELTPEALASELRLLNDAERKIKGRKTGLEVMAEDLLTRGKAVPGWALMPSYSRETWVEGAETQVMTLAEKFFKVRVSKPPKLITPNQARKVLPTSVVAMYAHKPSTGVKLTRIDPLTAEKAFNK